MYSVLLHYLKRILAIVMHIKYVIIVPHLTPFQDPWTTYMAFVTRGVPIIG